MQESNFYVLSHVRLRKTEQQKRVEYLQNTLAQLKQYHKVAPVFKRQIIFLLMAKYENLINSIKEI